MARSKLPKNLSLNYANTPQVQKIVEKDHILGYVVAPGPHGSAIVWPLYRAEIHVKSRGGRLLEVHASYEQGPHLHGSYYDDPEGSRFATIAAMAISGLNDREQQRRWTKENAEEKAKAKKKRKKRKPKEKS